MEEVIEEEGESIVEVEKDIDVLTQKMKAYRLAQSREEKIKA